MSSVTFPNGNVGIGLTGPLVSLDVDGNTLIRGANTNTPSTPASAMEFLTGRSNVGGLVSGQTNADIAFQYGGGGYRHFIQTRHNSSISTAGGNDIDFYINNSTTAAGSVDPTGTTVNGNIQVMTLANYNGTPAVGIGSNAPTQVLDIKGVNTAPVASGTASTAIFRMENTTGNGNVLDMGNYSASPYGTWLQATDRTSLAATYPIVLQPVGGNVGIGTSSPSGALQIVTPSNNGNVGAWSSGNVVIGQSGSQGAALGLSYSTTDNSGTAYLSALAPNVSWEYMGFRASNYIFYANGGTEAMRINSSGYIGIDNASPNFGIDDNLANSATYAKFGSAAPVYIVANSPMVGFNTWWNGGYTYGTSGYGGMLNFNQELSGGFNFLTAGSGTGGAAESMSSRLSITNGGYVGINTTSPSYLLTLAGTGSVFGMDNTAVMAARNASGNYEQFLWPRWSDNIMYLNYGSSGFNIRNDNSTPVMFMNSSGYVGIGTTSPAVPLDIQIDPNFNQGSYGWLNSAGNTSTASCSSCPVSFRAIGRVMGAEFDATSDRRIKTNIMSVNTESALDVVNGLKVVHYEYVDKRVKGAGTKTGFIAQEVESAIPDAVRTSTDFIPNVYGPAAKLEMVKNCLKVTTAKANEFRADDQIKFYDKSNKSYVVSVSRIIDPQTFEINNWTGPSDTLFVYGKQVEDLKSVDFDQLTAVSIGAVQELDKKVNTLETENKQLKCRNEELENKLNALQNGKADAGDVSQLKLQLEELKQLMQKNGIRSDK